MSSGVNVGVNSFSKNKASSPPIRITIIVPTFPKMASRTSMSPFLRELTDELVSDCEVETIFSRFRKNASERLVREVLEIRRRTDRNPCDLLHF